MNESEVEAHSDLIGYIVPGVFAAIFVVGAIGNGILISVVLLNRDMRTRPNVHLVSLAVGDLILLAVSVPFFGLIYTYPNWPYGSFLCKLSAFLKALSLGVSIFTLTALSWDRYSACIHPMQRRTADNGLRRTVAVASVIWASASVLAFFDAGIANVREYTNNSEPFFICESHLSEWPTWFPCFRACLRFTVFFVLPISIIAVVYSLMARSLWSNHAHIPQDDGSANSPAAQRQVEARRKIARLVLIMVVLFVVCWLPRHVFLLWFHCPSDGDYNLFWHIWKMVAYCLCFSNSCINPLVLCILSEQYRGYFKQYLCCKWSKSRHAGQVEQRRGTWQAASLSMRINRQLSTDPR